MLSDPDFTPGHHQCHGRSLGVGGEEGGAVHVHESFGGEAAVRAVLPVVSQQ